MTIVSEPSAQYEGSSWVTNCSASGKNGSMSPSSMAWANSDRPCLLEKGTSSCGRVRLKMLFSGSGLWHDNVSRCASDGKTRVHVLREAQLWQRLRQLAMSGHDDTESSTTDLLQGPREAVGGWVGCRPE